MGNRALGMLIVMTVRAKVRRSLRGARTLRGALFIALGAVVLLLWLGPALVHAQMGGRTDPETTRTFFPLLLLAMCVSNLVTSAGERAVAFSPAEVDLLFAAPFTRRQLLGYKITRSAVAAISAALLFSMLFLRYSSFWLAAFTGVFLALMLVQLLSMAVVLIGQTIGERAFTRGRKIALLAIVLILAAAVVPILHSAESSFFGVARELRNAPAAKVLLAPFDIFGRVITAESVYPDLVQWSLAAMGMIGVLMMIVMWLDAQYLEVSAAAGQRVYERVQRVRSAGGMALRTTGSPRLRIPMLPRFGGTGPIAWRQLTAAVRQSRSLLILLLLLSLAAGPLLYMGGLDTQTGGGLVGIAFWLTIMLANTLRFDFRGDVDHIDVLKSLPVTPLAISVAQLVAPVVVMTVLQLALLSGLVLLFDIPAALVVAAALLVIPFNVLLFAVENIIFLLFPARYVAGPGDLQGFGRQIVVFMLKMIALLIGTGIAAGAGLIVFAISDSLNAALIVAGSVLWIEAIAILPAVMAAYLRFDPSMDTPAA